MDTTNNKPWFLYDVTKGPKDSQEVAQTITSNMDTHGDSLESTYQDDFAASWYFERDRIAARYGGIRGAYQHAGSSVNGDYLSLEEGETDVQSASLIGSATNTVCAWLFSESPPVGIKASNLPLEAQASVEMYGLALDSLLNTPENADTEEMVARDGVLKGFACAWPQYIDGEISVRRLVAHQFHADAHDARDGKPRCVYVTEYRDKYSLANWVDGFKSLPSKKEKAKAIRELRIEGGETYGSSGRPSLYEWEAQRSGVQDSVPRVRVVHAWRLASAPGKTDGRYVCIAGSGPSQFAVIDQEFTRTTSPVVWWSPSPGDEGIRGLGLYHSLVLWQKAIDRSIIRIQRTTDKHGWPKVFFPHGTEDMIDDFAAVGVRPLFGKAGGVNTNAKPFVIPGIALLREDIEWVDKMQQMSLNLAGVNSMMASGGSRLGAGASAIALAEESYRATDRLSITFERFKRFKLKLARQVLFLLDDVLEVQPDYAAEFLYKNQRRSLTWAELRKQTSGYVVDVELRGILSSARGGRVSTIMDMAARELIDNATAKEMLLTTPDVRRAAALANTGTRLVDWQLDTIVRSTLDKALEKDLDLAYAIEDMDVETLGIAVDRSGKMLMRALFEAAKPETRTKLRTYKLAAEQLLRSRTAPPMDVMPPAGAGPVAPGAPDMMPPAV